MGNSLTKQTLAGLEKEKKQVSSKSFLKLLVSKLVGIFTKSPTDETCGKDQGLVKRRLEEQTRD